MLFFKIELLLILLTSIYAPTFTRPEVLNLCYMYPIGLHKTFKGFPASDPSSPIQILIYLEKGWQHGVRPILYSVTYPVCWIKLIVLFIKLKNDSNKLKLQVNPFYIILLILTNTNVHNSIATSSRRPKLHRILNKIEKMCFFIHNLLLVKWLITFYIGAS